jgi:hypothetical protein
MISIVLRLCQPSFIKCIRPDINITVLYYNTFCIGLLFIGILSHFQQYFSYIWGVYGKGSSNVDHMVVRLTSINAITKFITTKVVSLIPTLVQVNLIQHLC